LDGLENATSRRMKCRNRTGSGRLSDVVGTRTDESHQQKTGKPKLPTQSANLDTRLINNLVIQAGRAAAKLEICSRRAHPERAVGGRTSARRKTPFPPAASCRRSAGSRMNPNNPPSAISVHGGDRMKSASSIICPSIRKISVKETLTPRFELLSG